MIFHTHSVQEAVTEVSTLIPYHRARSHLKSLNQRTHKLLQGMRTISSIYGRKRLCVIGLHVRRYTCSRVTSQALRLLSYILQKMLQQLHQQLQQQQQQLQQLLQEEERQRQQQRTQQQLSSYSSYSSCCSSAHGKPIYFLV